MIPEHGYKFGGTTNTTPRKRKSRLSGATILRKDFVRRKKFGKYLEKKLVIVACRIRTYAPERIAWQYSRATC